MFPPTPTNNPQEWLQDLYSSLKRAGDHFSDDAVLQQNGDETTLVLYLRDKLPDDGPRLLSRYIKEYSKAVGWSTKVSCTQRYVRLISSIRKDSKDASRAAKNP